MITLTLEEKKSRIFFLDDTKKYFDENLQPILHHDYLFKFMMVKNIIEDPLKMVIMSIMNYHPNAVLQYMKENELQTILTNGGGKLMFSKHTKFTGFSGASKSFGGVDIRETEDFMQIIWPSREIYHKDINLPAQPNKLFTYEEIEALLVKV